MSTLLSKTKSGIHPGVQQGTRPPAAIEIALDGVVAAALPKAGQAPVYAFAPLRPEAIAPGIGEPNLMEPEWVVEAIRTALGEVSSRTRAVTLVIPDAAVRVFTLDFDSMPSRAADALSVLRFRLRKMVPFDVEHAGVSYQILTESRDEVKVLAAVLPGAILADYEAAVRMAGYEPGAVLSSTLAALEGVDAMEAVLLANLSGRTLTTAIATGQNLLLYRSVELPENPAARQEEAARGIAVAAAYYEDRLQAAPQKLHYAGDGEAAEFARWIDLPELEVVDLAPRSMTGAVTPLGKTNLAGVTGALVGAR